ncbi:MAG: hypothetical protein U1E27_05820 [Kiritimatiellia bacterium]|nr:hypothetical protein [Kiritimatiellia bacterium]
MNNMEFRFGRWIEQAIELYKRNFALLAIAGLLQFALSVLSLGILAGPMAAGLILLVFRLMDDEQPPPEAADLFQGFRFALPAFLHVAVWTAILALAYHLLPTFLWLVLTLSVQIGLAFTLFLIVDRRMDFWPAAMESLRRVKANIFPMMGIVLTAAILGGVGLLLCGVGVALTLPLGACLLAIVYRDQFPARATPPEPQMMTLNVDSENG